MHWSYNDIQLQSVASRFCGHYCVLYCILRSRGIVAVNNYEFNSLLTYLPMYSQLSGVCGRLVAKFVRTPADDAASPATRLPSLGSHVGTSVWLWLVSPLARE